MSEVAPDVQIDPAMDQNSLDVLVQLIGPAECQAAITGMLEEIERILDACSAVIVDRNSIARAAHKLVFKAEMVGLPKFAAGLATLERRIRVDEEVPVVVDAFRQHVPTVTTLLREAAAAFGLDQQA